MQTKSNSIPNPHPNSSPDANPNHILLVLPFTDTQILCILLEAGLYSPTWIGNDDGKDAGVLFMHLCRLDALCFAVSSSMV